MPGLTPDNFRKPISERPPLNDQARRKKKPGMAASWRCCTLALVGAVWLPSAGAIVCSAPGSHPTVQAAVDDVDCTEVALAPGPYLESVQVPRSLVIAGAAAGGTVIQGRITATGGGTVVELVALRVENACTPAALVALQGARVDGFELEVVRWTGHPCPDEIFADGFESGNTATWDVSVPQP